MTTTDGDFNDAVVSRKNIESSYDNKNYLYDVSTDIDNINTKLLNSYTNNNNKVISDLFDNSYNT